MSIKVGVIPDELSDYVKNYVNEDLVILSKSNPDDYVSQNIEYIDDKTLIVGYIHPSDKNRYSTISKIISPISLLCILNNPVYKEFYELCNNKDIDRYSVYMLIEDCKLVNDNKVNLLLLPGPDDIDDRDDFLVPYSTFKVFKSIKTIIKILSTAPFEKAILTGFDDEVLLNMNPSEAAIHLAIQTESTMFENITKIIVPVNDRYDVYERYL